MSVPKETKILVVDDSATNNELLNEILEDEGYRVLCVADGQTAIRKANSYRFDLILLDIMMPEMSGFDVCRQLKRNEATKETPVIFLTARQDVNSIAMGFQLGAIDYITKPFNRPELLARIRNHLNLKRTEEQLKIELSERKKAEKALRESEKMYSDILSEISDAVFVTDQNGRFVFVCANVLRIFGYTAQEIYTLQNINRLFHEQEFDFDEIIEKGEIHNLERIIENRKGEKRYLLVNLKKVNIKNGKILYSCRDISERIAVEKALAKSEERFKTVFNDTNSILLIIEPDTGQIVDANKTAVAFYGYPASKLKNMTIYDINILSKNELDAEIRKAFHRTKNYFHFKHRLANGQIRDIEVYSVPLNIGNNSMLISTIHDITERKQMEKRIISAIIKTEEKERSRFAKDLHDGLGALLSSINIYINLLNSGALDEDEEPQILDNAKEIVAQAIQSTKEIANNLRPTVLSAFGLIPSINSFCEKIRKTKIIQIDFDAEHFSVNLSKDSEIILFRVVNELINNTLKHASAKRIELTIENDNENVMLTYLDDGVGFDAENIFSDDNKTSGLKNIVSRIHSIDGEIEFFSKKNSGVKSKITIPI